MTQTLTRTVTVDSASLTQILDRANRFTNADQPHHPQLAYVYLHTHDWHLIATATDRITIGQADTLIHPDGPGEALPTVAVHRRDARTLARALRDGSGTVDVAVTGTHLAVTGSRHLPTAADSVDVTVACHPLTDTGFVANLNRALTDAWTHAADTPTTVISVDMGYLARFTPDRHAVTRLRFNGAGPVYVEAGTNFRGVIMPLRDPRPGKPRPPHTLTTAQEQP